jgi:xylan 1,4-beta-xylosidase
MSHQSRTFTQLLCLAAMLVASLLMPAASARTSDNGNGSFTNPVLYADYPDPDIIRVGGDFYMVTTTFVSIPGLEILHSNDLINWNICEYAVSTLDFGPKYSLIGGSEYGGGVWAPSIRYHDGTFYIIDNIQSFGTVVFGATNPAGPWGMTKLNGYLFDPGLLFDDDGTPLVYNGTGGHISVAVLDDDLKAIITNTPAYTLPTGEGSHAYKIKGTYYVFNSVFGQFPVLLCSKSTKSHRPFYDGYRLRQSRTVGVSTSGRNRSARQRRLVGLFTSGFRGCRQGSVGRTGQLAEWISLSWEPRSAVDSVDQS